MTDPNPSTAEANWPPEGYEIDTGTATIFAGEPTDEGEAA